MELPSSFIPVGDADGNLKNIKTGPTGARFFAAYVGPSMNPTLREPEIMEILPYGNRSLRVGDVVIYLPPESDQAVVHRIIRISAAGIATRGDNNNLVDPFLLQPKSIKGQVVAVWGGRQQWRKVAGGLPGRLISHWLHLRRVLDYGVSSLLHPIYHFICRGKLIARMLPVPFRPRVIVFHSRGSEQFQLLMGKRMIGRYDEQKRQWLIQRPFQLFVDVTALPVQQESEDERFD